MPAGCLRAHYSGDASTGGDTPIEMTGGQTGSGGVTGIGGDIAGEGGSGAGGTTGEGGSGAGGLADAGVGGSGAGGTGAGGTGTGGSGTGGSSPDGGNDAPTGLTPNALGQVVITEIMVDTTNVNDDNGEWVELYNPSSQDTYDLLGCVLADKSNQHQITDHVIVGPQKFVTLARFGTTAGGFPPNYNYLPPACICPAGGPPCPAGICVKFSNEGDLARLTCGLIPIDEVNFTSMDWLMPNVAVPMVPHGRSYTLDPAHYSATDNDDRLNWCTGSMTYAGSDMGTPGRMNPTCTCSINNCPF
jgi:hypothetical protein